MTRRPERLCEMRRSAEAPDRALGPPGSDLPPLLSPMLPLGRRRLPSWTAPYLDTNNHLRRCSGDDKSTGVSHITGSTFSGRYPVCTPARQLAVPALPALNDHVALNCMHADVPYSREEDFQFFEEVYNGQRALDFRYTTSWVKLNKGCFEVKEPALQGGRSRG